MDELNKQEHEQQNLYRRKWIEQRILEENLFFRIKDAYCIARKFRNKIIITIIIIIIIIIINIIIMLVTARWAGI